MTDSGAMTIDDRRYPEVSEFENGTLDPQAFDHEAHVYIAWNMLERCSVAETVDRFSAAIKRLTRALGVEEKYHETITWFFLLLIAERKLRSDATSWAQFRADNADLIADRKSLLHARYTSERIASPLARRQFLLPNR